MTNTTTNKKYERIEWGEVRAGDQLIHWNGDHLTVIETFPDRLRAAGIDRLNERWEQGGFFPYRKVEPLPTTPGAYVDKRGNVWLRDEGWDEKPWIGQGYSDWLRSDEVRYHAPFTRLVPMPTEEQVYEAIDLATSDRVIGEVQPAAVAVMALLAGEGGGDDE